MVYKMRLLFAALFLGLFTALAISGCQGKASTQGSAVGLDNLLGVGPPVGSEAPDFSVNTVDDLAVQKSDLQGKVVVLQGFSPGCPSCAREIRTLSRLYPVYKDKGLEIISADALNTPKGELRDYIAKTFGDSAPWHWVVFNPDLLRAYNVKATETTIVIDRSGKVSYVDGTLTDEEKLKAAIEKVI